MTDESSNTLSRLHVNTMSLCVFFWVFFVVVVVVVVLCVCVCIYNTVIVHTIFH